ncbi:MAG: putative Ig domain-containing protein [Nitrospira sp.]|nr:putative Ig domain-containing protein [Nitrospira sp.]
MTVNEVNIAPVLAPIGNKTVNEETELRFTISGFDADVPVQALTYSATGLPVGATFDPLTREFVWTPTELQGPGSYQVTFSVTDGVVSTSETITITVNEVNVAPVLNPIGNQSVNEETELRFTISGSDVDDPTQTLVYSATGLPTGATFDAATREFVWTPTEAQGPGSYTVTFSVTDGVVSTSELVTITVNEVNIAPVLAPIGSKSVNEEEELRFTISGSDVDAPTQTLIYSATGLPVGATFDAVTREFVWTPTEAQGPGSYNVTFSVTDGLLTTSETITITVNEVNIAPVLAPIGNKTVNEETELRFTISGSDVDDPVQTLVYSATGLPTGATFELLTREFIWTPTETQGPGVYNVTFSVTDGVVTTSELVTITVNEVNIMPVLAPIGNQTVNEGALLTFTATATDADVPVQTLTYSLGAGAPAGAVIDPTTGWFTWTPVEGPGMSPSSLTVQVTDGVVTTSETLALTVVNVAPTVSLIPATNVQEGVSATYQIAFQDPGLLDTHTIQINWGDGSALETYSLPAQPSVLSPQHAYAESGTYTLTVIVTDDEGASGAASATVTVANVAPSVTVTPATQTVQYSDAITPIVITASDVTADLLNITTAWSTNGTSWTAGLPDAFTLAGGLTLTGTANQVGNASWTLSGIADLDPAQTYTIRVTVTDKDGGMTIQQAVIDPTQEDAGATYTGPLFLSTADLNTSTATVQLRATVQDITAMLPASDPAAGVVTQATVTFVNRDTNTVIAANLPVTLIDPADPKTGTASYNWTVDLGNLDSESYTIGVIVNGSYSRNSGLDNSVVTVSKPLQNFVTGGGYLVNQRSTGLYAGESGEKTNLGFNVKFNKQLTNIQGKVNVIVRQNGHVYQIKTNSTDSLAVQSIDPLTQQAVFTGKANLKDITDPLNPITIAGNLDLVATVTDRGEPGTTDSVAFTLWKQNELWYASAWNGVQTVEQVLVGGNIQVHTDPSALMLAETSPVPSSDAPTTLTLAQAAPLVAEAQAQWVERGQVSAPAALTAVEVRIADLPGATLAWSLGPVIWLDADAAGRGWFIDPTPQTNAEFHFVQGLSQWVADAHSPAFSRVDLLTTLLHELGHVLGYGDQPMTSPVHATLMTETLATGTRRLPSALDLGVSGLSGLSGSSSLSGVTGSDSALSTPALSPVEGSFVMRHAPAHRSLGEGGAIVPNVSALSPQSSALSATPFAGMWGGTSKENGNGMPIKPVIAWDEDDTTVTPTSAPLGGVKLKSSWLAKFLSATGVKPERPALPDFEVLLPGKKK